MACGWSVPRVSGQADDGLETAFLPSRGREKLQGSAHPLGDRRGNREPESGARGTGGPASKRVIVGYGFWIFVLSDIIMFAAFFAGYAVLRDGTADGPAGRDLFDLGNVAVETVCLLVSSFVCGLASLALLARRHFAFQAAMAVTFLLGAVFVALEVREFAGMVASGAGPSRSTFLTAFFTLVGCHGLHVTSGLLWLLTMMAQVAMKGFRPDIMRRTMCFALFWHALDIVWVAVFTVVYLMGAIA
jgi:cytochrome o ubiquinol oxidase subunit 3